MDRPWSVEEFPIVAAWLKANQGPLELIAAAADRTHYYSPRITGAGPPLIMALLPDVWVARSAAKTLTARAMLQLHQGNAEAAWQELQSCHRLAGHFARIPQTVPFLVGIAIDGMACDGDLAVAQDPSLTPDQRQRLWQAFRDLPILPNPVDCIHYGERIAFIDSVIDMSRGANGFGGEEDIDALSLWSMKHFLPWNSILLSGNEWYDRIVEAFDRDTYIQSAAALKTVQDDLDTHLEKLQQPEHRISSFLNGTIMSDTFGGTMIALLLPSADSILQAATRQECKRQLVDIAFALEQYQADHDSYPDTLSELVPKHFAKLPKDLFTEEDLKYRRQDDGYLLYSVGANQQDDNGLSEWKDEVMDSDDFAVRVPRVEPAAP